MKQSYYEVLGVRHTASKEEISASFVRMAMANHPDTKMFEAYENLSSSSKRSKHNSKLSQSDIIRIEKNYGLYSSALAMFTKLGENVGKEVTVFYTWDWHFDTTSFKLENVTAFTSIKTEGKTIPFVDNNFAILIIANNETGEILYSNTSVVNSYEENSLQNRTRAIALSWGHAEAQRYFKAETAQERKWKEDKEKADNEAKKNKTSLIAEGLQYIKPELADEWKEWTDKNTIDVYSACIVEVAVAVMKEFSNGADFDIFYKITYDMDLTCTLKDHSVSVISHFHARGKDFKKYWNAQYDIIDSSEQETFNSTVFTTYEKETGLAKTKKI